MGKTSWVAKNRYNAKAYDRMTITVPKGRKATINAHAQGQGESVNALVNRLLREDMGLPEGEWKLNKPAEDGKE